nr:primosomal protein N' [Opitutales bacterium]
MVHSPKYATVMTLTWAAAPLLYAIPDNLLTTIEPGMLVEIPFGKSIECGIVYEIFDHLPCKTDFTVKNITQLLYPCALIGHDILELIQWISNYYVASPKCVAEAVIPSAIRKLVNPKISVTLEIASKLADDVLSQLQKKSPKQFEIYQRLLTSSSPVYKNTIKSVSALRALVDKKIVIENFVQIPRIEYHDKFGNDHIQKKSIVLNSEQRMAADDIISSINKKTFCTHLLHGITGSGKTEVYIEAINRVLEQNGDVIMLVPELTLTPQTVSRIRNGIFKYNDRVLVWHSGLSEGERRDAWLALSRGDAKIVIGARSAIFSPLKNLKLVIVDEEHEPSYKQSDSPRYHARDVAVYRAKLNDAVCVLGSATPALESLYNAQIGKYRLNTLKHRVDQSILPKVEIVNMQQENRQKIISSHLQNMIDDRLNKHEQIILFLNRRGYATIVLCKACNYSAQCPRCSVSLTYHSDQRKLLCHLCGYEEPLPVRCPVCGSVDILQRGIGSQKLEQVTNMIFPGARIARVDSDTIAHKNAMQVVLN